MTGSPLVAKTTYSYDGNFRLLSIVATDDNDDPIDSFEYAYDAAVQMTSRIDTQLGVNSGSPRTTLHDYDDQGQLTADGATSYSYDTNGNRDSYTYDSIYTNQIGGRRRLDLQGGVRRQRSARLVAATRFCLHLA